MIVATVVLGFAVLILLLIKVSRVGKREHYLPPGPPTLPLLGNLHMLPTEFSHYKFTEWAKRYGHIYSLKIGPGTAVVITSVKAVKELLDKRSATTSDRPPTYAGDVVTGGFNMGIGRYADNWRASRKACQAILTAQANTNVHLPIQKAEATQLLYDIVKTPEHFFHHIRRYGHSTILAIVYGVRSPRYNSPITTTFSHVQRMWLEFLAPGAPPPVDLLSFLKHIPEGWPGAGWKRAAKEIRKLQRELYFGLMDICEDRIRQGDEGNGYFMEKIVKTPEKFGMTRELSGYLGGVLMDAGSDTTATVLHSIVLMLAAFPEVQKKAQEEMDRVVGSERIPTPDDWKELPYIQALIKEVNRFRPAAPLALPHASTADENFEGYIIPKGSILFMNTWGIFHDPELFENPETFDPDRYLNSEYGTKPGVDDRDFRHTLTFGAGRRICPGIHVANTSFMLFAMYCIWAFDCGPAIDPETKKPIPVDIWAYMKGLVTGPKPFKCSITIRSPQRVEIIEKELVDSIDTFLPFELYLCEEDKTWVAKTRDTLLAH